MMLLAPVGLVTNVGAHNMPACGYSARGSDIHQKLISFNPTHHDTTMILLRTLHKVYSQKWSSRIPSAVLPEQIVLYLFEDSSFTDEIFFSFRCFETVALNLQLNDTSSIRGTFEPCS